MDNTAHDLKRVYQGELASLARVSDVPGKLQLARDSIAGIRNAITERWLQDTLDEHLVGTARAQLGAIAYALDELRRNEAALEYEDVIADLWDGVVAARTQLETALKYVARSNGQQIREFNRAIKQYVDQAAQLNKKLR